jgi:Pilus formation protein N terminal region
MDLAFERIGRNGRRHALASVLFALAALVAAPSAPAVAATASPTTSTITIVLDQAKVMKLPDGVVTLVVGNPLIADVSIQKGGLIVLTGKGYGVTNLLALDDSGKVVAQRQVRVRGPRDSLIVYRGVERESYSCTPNCEQRITLGDSPQYFNTVLGQIGNRTGQAQGSAQSK